MVNKVILIGNLGRDPEVNHTQSGTAVATLSVATTRRVKKGDQWESETEWHRVVAWGKTAEFCGNYLQKGSKVYVEGRLSTREWADRYGQKRYTTEVVAESVQSLDPRNDGGNSGNSDTPASPEPFGGMMNGTGENVPF